MLTVNILFLLSVISISILLFYYFFFFWRLSIHKKKDLIFDQPISIIICAKDEEKNLAKNLPEILKQKYGNFEVIVVNDQSVDKTSFLLKNLNQQYDNLVVVTIDEHINHKIGKKFALTLGIKTAKYEHILLTDADCVPNSKEWIKKIASNYAEYDVILGYGAYQKNNSILNRLIRFDTFNVAQQYLSYALVGLTYMGVGRNLAYKKSVFFKNKGFASHINIASGDDDLFIQEIADNHNICIEINQDTHTISEVAKDWKTWIYQKRRHITTSSLYKTKFKFLLSIYPYAQFIFWISLFMNIFFDISIYLLVLLLIKLGTTYIINYKIMKKLSILDLYWLHPIYEIILLFIQVNFVLLNIFSKPKKWTK